MRAQLSHGRDDARVSSTGCVWVPRLAGGRGAPADAALRDGAGRSYVERVGVRDVVRAASAEARAEGVTRGMRRREAEARCPEAVCVDADDAVEARTFELVARAVEQFTPRVVLDRPGRARFPTRGPSRYFGGDDVARRASPRPRSIAARRSRWSPTFGSGIADGGFAARLAAAPADDRGRSRATSAAFVAPWPVSTLGDDELASLLVRLGLPTLGDVAALPSDAVLARFGSEGRAFHELARGIDPGPPVCSSPAARSRRTDGARPARRTRRRRRRSRRRNSPTGCCDGSRSAGSRARAW